LGLARAPTPKYNNSAKRVALASRRLHPQAPILPCRAALREY
jgi:hypothetical protein